MHNCSKCGQPCFCYESEIMADEEMCVHECEEVIRAPKGLYGKYIIKKSDGSPVDSNAFYFVLRCDKDRHALAALEAYAFSCQDDDSLLAKQLIDYVRKTREKLNKTALTDT